ncbi:MAG TPA: alpha/beta fold hydrolase, partial [Solirubrobacteraceae bacterium]
MPEVSEHAGTLDDQPTFWLQAPVTTPSPVVYLHGVPTSSEDWRPFLAQTGGFAPDLPGFGRAGKRGDLPCTMEFYDAWLERFLDQRGIDRFSLLVHDWGGVGLLTAQRLADRVDRVVVLNAAPLLPGYRWHWIAKVWRTPVLGEVFMGATVRTTLRVLMRRGFKGRVPPQLLDDVVRF